MSKLLATLNLLFSPRRSFVYRELEGRLRQMEIERDDYRQRWVEAVNHALVIARQPRLEAGKPRDTLPPEPIKRLSRAEIEADYQARKAKEFLDWQLKQRQTVQPNDVDTVQ